MLLIEQDLHCSTRRVPWPALCCRVQDAHPLIAGFWCPREQLESSIFRGSLYGSTLYGMRSYAPLSVFCPASSSSSSSSSAGAGGL